MKVLALTYKDSTDYLGNLILKNNHPSQYLFEGGYASFDADTLDGWHYYVQDYMGNNRMVVNVQDNSVEQETHYYPYGGVIGDLSTDENLQAYKFENKELDRTFGLDWYDIQARQYDAIGIPGWNAVDPLAEKYYGISPYSYCAGDPVNLGDLDGRDTCVLLDSIAVGGLGHMAALVQHENGRWYLYSKNGAYSGNVGPLPYGKAGQNDDGGKHEDVVSADDSNSTGYDSPEDFMNSDLGARYQTFVRLDTSPEEDKAIIDGIKEELEKTYFVGGSNCARSVQNGLSNAGLDPGVPSERNIIKRKAPNNIFIQIIKNNNNRIKNEK